MDNFTKFMIVFLVVLVVGVVTYGECCPASQPYKNGQYIKNCHDHGGVMLDDKCCKVIIVE